MKVTRRELVGLAVSVAAVAQGAAQGTPQEAPEEVYKRNADTLDKFAVKMETEPTFSFKA